MTAIILIVTEHFPVAPTFHCDDLFLVVYLLLLLGAFYVRVDTVIFRNGMNKVSILYSQRAVQFSHNKNTKTKQFHTGGRGRDCK